MAVTILLPTPLRRFAAGSKRVDVASDTVQGALTELAERNPELRRQLFNEQSRLQSFVHVFLGSANIRTLGYPEKPLPLQDGDELVLLLAVAGGAATTADLSSDEVARYRRHLVMPEIGEAGQRRLKGARVLCVGAGGLGSPVTLYLGAAGVGTLGIVDFDVVDVANLQRQVLYSTDDIGRPKLDAARERLHRLNPEIDIVAHSLRLTDHNALDLVRQYDIVADATDNYATRYMVNDACVMAGKPDVQAAIFRLEGHLSVFGAKGGPCYRCAFPEPPPPGLVPPGVESGILGVVPGILGTLQALEVIKLILGIGSPLVGRLMLFDALEPRFRELAIERRADCASCGEHSSIRRT